MTGAIHYFVHGRGRGHATRALSIVPHLIQEGFSIEIAGGADAAKVLRHWSAFRHVSVVRPGFAAVLDLPTRTAACVQDLRRRRPDVVVSDGDQAAVLAARACGIPSVAVGHDLTFTNTRIAQGLPRGSLLHQRANAFIPARVATRKVAVHFLPCSGDDPNVCVARPDSLSKPGPHADADRPFLLCYFRDASPPRLLELLRHRGYDVRVFSGSTIVSGSRGDTGGCEAPVHRDAFLHLLRTCTAVVTSAGSNVLAECVLLHKPVLALHRARDHEQRLNAILAARAKVAVACAFEHLNPHIVERFFDGVRQRTFARVELEKALPPVSQAVCKAVKAILGTRREWSLC